MSLAVLYRDDDLLAVAKPSGLLVHRGWADDADTALARARAIAGRPVHPVHRLDRGTSGVLLFALHVEAAAALSGQLAEGGADKRYLALVRGVPPGELTVAHPIPRVEGGPRVPAVTELRLRHELILPERRFAVVEARPLSGRLHQVRRHLKHAGHPVVGDVNYGRGEVNRLFRDRYGITRLALHALAIALRHPRTGAPLALACPPPDELRIPLESLGAPPGLWASPFDSTPRAPG